MRSMCLRAGSLWCDARRSDWEGKGRKVSRLGQKPVVVPEGVEVSLKGRFVGVKGPLGQLDHEVPDVLQLEFDRESKELRVTRKAESKRARSLHGLHRALIANIIEGVAKGFTKNMEIHGVGYNVQMTDKELVLQVGFCHTVNMPFPPGVEVEIRQNAAQPDRPAQFAIKGSDKQAVGQFAAEVRAVRPPEPYKGKGIRYADEHVRRKVGKALAGMEG